MTKTYSTKSNAIRAAAKVAGAVVERIETAAGYQFAVVLPVIGETVYPVSGEWDEAQGCDDVPVKQVSDEADLDVDAVMARNLARFQAERAADAVEAFEAPAADPVVEALINADMLTESASFATPAAVEPMPPSAPAAKGLPGVLVDGPDPVTTSSLRNVMITVATASAPEIAAFLARRYGQPAYIINSASGEHLAVVHPAPVKAVGAIKSAKPRKLVATRQASEMTKGQRIITDLCQRVEGATAGELAKALGWPSIAARKTCQGYADRFGFKMIESAKADGRGISFRMIPLDSSINL